MCTFLSLIGAITLVGMAVIVCIIFYEAIRDTVDDLKWKYKRNHRFSKPPTAQCYCKDCIYYKVNQTNSVGTCTRGHIDKAWNIADSWFCWQASPYKKDPELNI